MTIRNGSCLHLLFAVLKCIQIWIATSHGKTWALIEGLGLLFDPVAVIDLLFFQSCHIMAGLLPAREDC